jgi:hypothetical protein
VQVDAAEGGGDADIGLRIDIGDGSPAALIRARENANVMVPLVFIVVP